MSEHLRLSAHLGAIHGDGSPAGWEPATQQAPDGYAPIVGAREVWTDGATLVVLGEPDPEDEDEDGESGHSCDVMGCGSCGWHVLAIGTVRSG